VTVEGAGNDLDIIRESRAHGNGLMELASFPTLEDPARLVRPPANQQPGAILRGHQG
jgi:hypothetical protein